MVKQGKRSEISTIKMSADTGIQMHTATEDGEEDPNSKERGYKGNDYMEQL